MAVFDSNAEAGIDQLVSVETDLSQSSDEQGIRQEPKLQPSETPVAPGEDPRKVAALDPLRGLIARLQERNKDYDAGQWPIRSKPYNSATPDLLPQPGVSEPRKETPSRVITRRRLLELAAASGVGLVAEYELAKATGTIAGTLAKALRDSDLGRTVVEVTEDPRSINSFLRTVRTAFELHTRKTVYENYGVELEPNPEFASITRLIEQGMQLYETRTGRKAYYEFSVRRKSDAYYNRVIKDWAGCFKGRDVIDYVTDSEAGGVELTQLMLGFLKSTPDTDWYVIHDSQWNISEYRDLVEKFNRGRTDGMRGRFRKAFEAYKEYRQAPVDELHEVEDNFAFTERFFAHEIGSMYEELCQEAGEGRISSSHALAQFLERNNGSLHDALNDTAIFFKILARNDLTTGLGLTNSGSPDYAEHVKRFSIFKDEFISLGGGFTVEQALHHGLGYNPDDKDFSPINQIGSVYHAWNIASLLHYFPARYLQVGTFVRQMTTLDTAGPLKVASDLVVAGDLYDVEALLRRYQRPQSSITSDFHHTVDSMK